ncbi:DNA replication factor Cdt1 [Chiloscyllium plagiosum]|uniref:DNA replication factor Cdt1 n=1 Tax=Chiloscyllium plagiosum TaxID=36176 RepID=UPI001CB7F066|nr:DNA replication factor Cdt1 [Chiloscyllium plagiosum]
MAQARLTDFFPQAKKPKPALKGSRSPGGRRLQPRKGRPAAAAPCPAPPPAVPAVPEPPDSCEWPSPGQLRGCSGLTLHPEAEVSEREPALSDLVTPSKSEPLGAGSRSSTGRKRSRSASVDGAPASAVGSQRAAGVPSARRCLRLEPKEEEENPVPKRSEAEQDAQWPPKGAPEPTDLSIYEPKTLRKAISKHPGLQSSDGRNKQTGTTPAKEGLSGLKARLHRIQKLAPVPGSFVSASEVDSDIKSRLKRVRELELKVQENKEVQKKTAEQVVTSGAEERVKTPAYQRFHNLAQDVPPGLTLPFKYKLLAEMFRSMDTVVSMLFNRSETITFAKVKQGVQDMMRKKFEERNVGQIKTVYPSAYKFRQEKGIPTWSDSLKRSSYQLTIDPEFEGEENSDGHRQLTASRLLSRRHIFSRNLVSIVKRYHKIFLASLNPPMHVPDDKIARWHPRFNIDEIPDIAAAELPKPPDLEKLTTAQEVLDKARSMMTPKMEKALANMALKTAEAAMAAHTEQKVEPKPLSPSPSPASNALKGISQSLIERIRAKEAEKMQATMTRTAAQTERLNMMMRLPDITRILRNVFVAERKPALVMSVACNRVADSYRSMMSIGDMEKHLQLLANVVPDWLSIHKIRKDVYLKLNKNMELNVVAKKIAEKIKEEEKA